LIACSLVMLLWGNISEPLPHREIGPCTYANHAMIFSYCTNLMYIWKELLVHILCCAYHCMMKTINLFNVSCNMFWKFHFFFYSVINNLLLLHRLKAAETKCYGLFNLHFCTAVRCVLVYYYYSVFIALVNSGFIVGYCCSVVSYNWICCLLLLIKNDYVKLWPLLEQPQ